MLAAKTVANLPHTHTIAACLRFRNLRSRRPRFHAIVHRYVVLDETDVQLEAMRGLLKTLSVNFTTSHRRNVRDFLHRELGVEAEQFKKLPSFVMEACDKGSNAALTRQPRRFVEPIVAKFVKRSRLSFF